MGQPLPDDDAAVDNMVTMIMVPSPLPLLLSTIKGQTKYTTKNISLLLLKTFPF